MTTIGKTTSACALCDGSVPGAGDSLAELAMLLTKADQDEVREAHQREASEEAAQRAEERAKVDEMQARADDSEIGGWVDGVAAIGSGVGDLGAANLEPHPGLDRQDVMVALKAGSSAAGKAVTADYKAAGERHDARASEHASRAGWAERLGRHAEEDAAAAKDSAKKVAEVVKEIRASERDAMIAVATFRA